MKDIIHKRCHNHPDREAVAVCAECGWTFCRECITEHDDRMFCASCLVKYLKPAASRRFHISDIAAIGQGFLGIVITWIFFYYFGQVLLSLPSSFHDGTFWNTGWFGVR